MTRLWLKQIRYAWLILLSGLLTACQDYQVKLNERPIYEPPVLINALALADAALETCVAQTITDGDITAIEQLTTLRCTHAGIMSVSGLEQAKFIQRLDLSNNELQSINSIAALTQLTQLILKGNTNLDCDELAAVKNKNRELIIQAPAHCAAVN